MSLTHDTWGLGDFPSRDCDGQFRASGITRSTDFIPIFRPVTTARVTLLPMLAMRAPIRRGKTGLAVTCIRTWLAPAFAAAAAGDFRWHVVSDANTILAARPGVKITAGILTRMESETAPVLGSNSPITVTAQREPEIAALPFPPYTTDDDLVELWLHGKAENTVDAYRADIAAFRAFSGKSLRATYLSDLQRYADALTGAPATRARRLKALKSLLSFAARLGYMPFNVGAAIRGPKVEEKLAERILSERQVFALLEAVEDNARDHALIRLLYNGGLRVSELVGVRWRNLIDGVANVTGKGGKTRVVRLSRGTWQELQGLRTEEALSDDRVFPMSACNAWKRVKRASNLAGIKGLPVSPHFLRHSHGTHALRRGADLATVRDTLGHDSISTTGRYLHARPDKSSGDYLAI